MVGSTRTIVVVPAFNEAERIGRVIAAMPRSVDEIVVVDDASADATSAIARASADPRVRVLTHAVNRGVGAAIATGYRDALSAGGQPRDALVVMAGDGQMDPSDLEAMTTPILEGRAGYVKGNRFAHPAIRTTMPRARHIGGLVFSRLTSLAIGEDVHDSQCGFTAMAREACTQLDLDALWPRYGYPNDLLAQLAERRIAIAEVCVRPVYAGEASGLRAWHCARIAQLVGRAWVRRMVTERHRGRESLRAG